MQFPLLLKVHGPLISETWSTEVVVGEGDGTPFVVGVGVVFVVSNLAAAPLDFLRSTLPTSMATELPPFLTFRLFSALACGNTQIEHRSTEKSAAASTLFPKARFGLWKSTAPRK